MGFTSPPSSGRGATQTATLPLSGRFVGHSRPDPLRASVGSWGPPWARDRVDAPRSRQGLGSPGPPIRAWRQETEGAPTCPSAPCRDRPRSPTPVGSRRLAHPSPGRLPSGDQRPSAFPSGRLEGAPIAPHRDPCRGSMTRPVSLSPPASYAHDGGCTWRSRPTGWRGVSRVGLELVTLAPTGSHQPIS